MKETISGESMRGGGGGGEMHGAVERRNHGNGWIFADVITRFSTHKINHPVLYAFIISIHLPFRSNAQMPESENYHRVLAPPVQTHRPPPYRRLLRPSRHRVRVVVRLRENSLFRKLRRRCTVRVRIDCALITCPRCLLRYPKSYHHASQIYVHTRVIGGFEGDCPLTPFTARDMVDRVVRQRRNRIGPFCDCGVEQKK